MNTIITAIFVVIVLYLIFATVVWSVIGYQQWKAKQKWAAEQRAAGKTIIERWGEPKKTKCNHLSCYHEKCCMCGENRYPIIRH